MMTKRNLAIAVCVCLLALTCGLYCWSRSFSSESASATVRSEDAPTEQCSLVADSPVGRNEPDIDPKQLSFPESDDEPEVPFSKSMLGKLQQLATETVEKATPVAADTRYDMARTAFGGPQEQTLLKLGSGAVDQQKSFVEDVTGIVHSHPEPGEVESVAQGQEQYQAWLKTAGEMSVEQVALKKAELIGEFTGFQVEE